ncbi:glutamate synthase [NADPH] large chain [Vibrio variabilis]|uniref:Glutamate synthase [NADPH] large chain n=1 Tax=Vibrio variabilis TaxID=990271 RepID=A0ABQ0J5L9_9VIBR|nr:glutamate synthase [NADPH] large chain [Vibrio variabilis]
MKQVNPDALVSVKLVSEPVLARLLPALPKLMPTSLPSLVTMAARRQAH